MHNYTHNCIYQYINSKRASIKNVYAQKEPETKEEKKSNRQRTEEIKHQADVIKREQIIKDM